ncbi:MAG: SDR family NAD(P)-dependent oxidoreductase [Schwartzia sp. (in: firmicutes)]
MNKWILLTGASSGIGRVTAKYMDEQGYNLLLVARSKEKLEALAAELTHPALVFPFDLCALKDIGMIFEQCKVQGIKLDGLVHCAGIGDVTAVRANVIEDMEKTMTTNYFSFVEMGKYFSLRKYSNDGASIVAISSISPLTCYPGACNYAASKGAVNTAVRIMSKEFMKRKIRVNAVLPGYVNTPMGPEENDPAYIAQQPLGIIQAPYVAYMVEFLLSDKAKYITGTLIPISGGMSY